MRGLIPLLLLTACCLDEFDENTVDRGTDPGAPWLNEEEENADPVANDDVADTFDGYHTVISVLDNDSDPDFNSLSVTEVSTPRSGGAELNDDGTVTYTPDAGFEGQDSFTYTIEDGKGGSATATVTVDVTGPASITITSPNDQDVLTVPFDIAFEFDGACVLAFSSDNTQGCHIHLILDGDDSDFPDLDGDGFSDAAYDNSPLQILETGEYLPPGEHTLELVLWRNDATHDAYDPRISDEITIFIAEPAVDTSATDTGGTTTPVDTSATDTGGATTPSDTSDTGGATTPSDTSDTGSADTGAADTADTATATTPADTSDTAVLDTRYNDTASTVP